MLTFRTIPPTTRRVFFVLAAAVDIITRVISANIQADLVLFGSNPGLADTMTIEGATGVAVPLIALPLILSPVAYLLGQIFVLAEANYVRLVSAAFIVGSFLAYAPNPWLSVFLAFLAYLILASGMLRSKSLAT